VTGKLISAEKFGKATWAERIDLATGRPVEAPNIRYETGDVTIWPGSVGAHNWQPMSYSPASGLVYIPTMQVGVRFAKGHTFPGANHAGGLSMGWVVTDDPADGKGALLGWDPVRQAPRWRVQHATIWNGGTLATAGNLVFQGTGDGWFSAWNAQDGERLWRFNAGLGIIGAPISYTANGRQYVSVLVGYGGSAAAVSSLMDVGWKYSHPRRLLTFALGGRQQLPATPPASMVVEALDKLDLTIDPVAAEAGSKLFLRCIGCHGNQMQGAGGPGPDLRESAIALDPEAMWTVLHDGALLERGMPRYANLTREQVSQLYAYIRAQARKVLGQQGEQRSK
jgi:quinohemoprotein ethanol dehydrogenase